MKKLYVTGLVTGAALMALSAPVVGAWSWVRVATAWSWV